MSAWPMVERELRVASRKGSTYWIRFSAASIALVILLGSWILMETLSGATGRNSIGSVLFAIISWMGFIAALSSGLFFTSDCLSSEKREGTLGLLFLTDLKGSDVVFGKMAANSVRSFFFLLAALPVIAVPILMGGVSGTEFFRACLGLINGLWFSLCVGMLASAWHRDGHQSLATTLGIIVLFTVGGPLLDLLVGNVGFFRLPPLASMLSPGFAFAVKGGATAAHFWTSLGISHLVGWGMFCLAAMVLPGRWQDTSRKADKELAPLVGSGIPAPTANVSAFRRVIDDNPGVWLFARERKMALGAWILISTMAILSFLQLTFGATDPSGMGLGWLRTLGFVILYIGLASFFSRFLLDLRQAGLLQLMLITSFPSSDVVRGIWRGFLRRFGLPIALLVLVAVLEGISRYQWTHQISNSAATTVTSKMGATVTNTIITTNQIYVRGGFTGGDGSLPVVEILVLLLSVARTMTTFLALYWFGLWSGLVGRSATTATLRTVVMVLVVPVLISQFLGMLGLGLLTFSSSFRGGSPSQIIPWLFALFEALPSALRVVFNILIVWWSRPLLLGDLRIPLLKAEDASATVRPPTLPPPLPLAT